MKLEKIGFKIVDFARQSAQVEVVHRKDLHQPW